MAGSPTALSMGLSGDNLNLRLPEEDVLAVDRLGRLKVSLGKGLDFLLGLTLLGLNLKLGKSPETLSEGGIEGDIISCNTFL